MPPPANERLRAGFEELRERFVAGLPERLEAVRRGLDEVRRQWPSPAPIEALLQHAHRLLGASEIFGIARVSAAARALEDLCRELVRDAAVAPRPVARLEERAAALEAAAEQSARERRADASGSA